jgi:hypothetical protein
MTNVCVKKQGRLVANDAQNNFELNVWEMAFVAGKCHLWAEWK